MQDLYQKCFEWFLTNFANGQHGSLQILAENAEGEVTMIKIYATDDSEMVDKSRSAIAQAGAVRFLGLGEGSLMGKRGPVPVFILYLQDGSDDKVQTAVMPYQRREDGAFGLSEWHEMDWDHGSWLPA